MCVLPQGALERLGLPSTESYVETLLRQYDGDQDGCVNYQDFASYVQKNEARIWQAFRCLALVSLSLLLSLLGRGNCLLTCSLHSIFKAPPRHTVMLRLP